MGVPEKSRLVKQMEKSAFFENIDKAMNILNVIKIREELQPLKKRLIFPRQRPIVTRIADINPEGRILTTLRLVDETVEIALPLLLVFSVSCLEHYLKQVSSSDQNLCKLIQLWEWKVGTELIQNIHEIRIKRNIIMHSPERKIDPKAEKEAKEHGITGYTQGTLLKLNVDQVKKDIDNMKLFVKAINS